eukprot:7922397-Pyramimonas_sp.AAC.1
MSMKCTLIYPTHGTRVKKRKQLAIPTTSTEGVHTAGRAGSANKLERAGRSLWVRLGPCNLHEAANIPSSD